MRYFNDDIVVETITFPYTRNEATQDSMTICYGTDDGFMLGAAVSAFSVAAENPQVNIDFHIFTNHISDAFRQRFENFAKLQKVTVVIHIINGHLLESLPENKLWSRAIYYRFIIADYFYSKNKKVLYIDSDIVCTDSLEPLFATDLQDKVVGAVTERDSQWWQSRASSLGEASLAVGYFNSGVLLINTDRWYEENITSQAIEKLQDSSLVNRLTYFDQDVLNLILRGKVLFLDRRYNVQYSLNYELGNKHSRPVDGSYSLLHYIGPTKPWHQYASQYAVSGHYFNMKKLSPWSDMPLLLPRSSMQLRYAAKHSLNQKNRLLGWKYYALYFKSKLNHS